MRLILIELDPNLKHFVAKIRAFDLMAEVYRKLAPLKTKEAIHAKDVLMGSMIGGGESEFRLGRIMLGTLLGCGKIDKYIYDIRRELRYGIMTLEKHYFGFYREIYK